MKKRWNRDWYFPRRCSLVGGILALSVGVALVYGLPSNRTEWTAFDAIAICRVTLLEDGTVRIPADLRQQIKQGEWWRLVTPTIIHLSLPHLLLNIALVYLLTVPVEAVIGTRRTALLILVVVASSNFAQSFYSRGPFGGMSTIWCGMLGYRSAWGWLRSDSAIALRPWLVRAGFVGVGIGVLSALPPLAAIRPGWIPKIANAAHITGIVTGMLSAALLHWLDDANGAWSGTGDPASDAT